MGKTNLVSMGSPRRRFCLSAAVIAFIALGACSKKASPGEGEAMKGEVREPAVAGGFYPGQPAVLKKTVDELLAQATKRPFGGRIVALIAPHAGYPYSGPTAAWAFKQLEGEKVSTVFLLGCSHRAYFPGASIYDGEGFRTPLGVVPVNRELARWLKSQDQKFAAGNNEQGREHSLEVELPFLQEALKEFSIIPILLGQVDGETVDKLGEALAGALRKDPGAVIVCSTDLTHYPPYDDACRIDRESLEAIKSMDPAKVSALERKYARSSVPNLHCVMCGESAVLATMKAASLLGVKEAEIVHYSNSGDASIGDKGQVVGYGAVVFVQKEGTNVKAVEEGGLSEASRRELLGIARRALETQIRTGRPPEIKSDNPELQVKRGVFVTLTEKGDLRGCMGHFEQDTPLYEIVGRQAVVSAAGDPRFPPVRPDELKDIHIEISVLSEPAPVSSYRDIVVGKHGVILRKGLRGATFLPQVAPEQGWDRDTMLTHLALKAGMGPDDWKEGCAYLVYTAQVFGEKD